MKRKLRYAVGGTSVVARLWVVLVAGLVLSASGCAGSSSTQVSERIGVVDPERVLSETDVGKRAKESLNMFVKDRQALIELEQKELRRMEDELVAQRSILSQDARKEREAQLRRRMLEYQQKVTEMNKEVQEKQQELLNEFRKRIQRAASKVAADQGLILVIEKGRDSPTLYHDARLDISEQVIQLLDHEGS